MWILKLKSVNSEVKSVDSEVKKCGFVKKNSHFFYCLLPKVWFKYRRILVHTSKCVGIHRYSLIQYSIKKRTQGHKSCYIQILTVPVGKLAYVSTLQGKW